ncbi:MAG: hypothetical protein WC666_01605, partial [Candidatus Paceibacterota bacterium]
MDSTLKYRCQVIESINAGSEQRAQLVLVILDLKPAAEFSIFGWNDTPEIVETAFKNAELPFLRRQNNKSGKTVAEYAVSKDPEIMAKLCNCLKLDPYQYGLWMGYPETAIRAFISKQIYGDKIPE